MPKRRIRPRLRRLLRAPVRCRDKTILSFGHARDAMPPFRRNPGVPIASRCDNQAAQRRLAAPDPVRRPAASRKYRWRTTMPERSPIRAALRQESRRQVFVISTDQKVISRQSRRRVPRLGARAASRPVSTSRASRSVPAAAPEAAGRFVSRRAAPARPGGARACPSRSRACPSREPRLPLPGATCAAPGRPGSHVRLVSPCTLVPARHDPPGNDMDGTLLLSQRQRCSIHVVMSGPSGATGRCGAGEEPCTGWRRGCMGLVVGVRLASRGGRAVPGAGTAPRSVISDLFVETAKAIDFRLWEPARGCPLRPKVASVQRGIW
jgi:hypothetical protein